jgi:hypothetical protein
MSLHDAVRFLIVLLNREGINLCFQERSRWHSLFYQLKQLPPTSGVPLAIRDAFFDWDGSSPSSAELAESLWSLCFTGCIEYSSPNFRDYRLSKGVAAIWEKEFDGLKKWEKDFLERVALGYARKQFTTMVAP